MNIFPVLNLYCDIQSELHKKAEYHINQQPPFQNLILKIGELCYIVKNMHDEVPEMLGSPDYLNSEKTLESIEGKEWLKQFDALILNTEFDYKSVTKIGRLSEAETKLIWTYSFWVVLQTRLLKQIIHHSTDSSSKVLLLWMLVESIHRQVFQYTRLQNTNIPEPRECHDLFLKSKKERIN